MISSLLLARLKRFEGIHKGQSCYIFGDGPSLKWFDLSAFKDRPAIACNNVMFHKGFDELDVLYYAIVAPWLFCPIWMQRHRNIRELRGLAAAYRARIHASPDIEFFLAWSNRGSIRAPNVTFLGRKLPAGQEQYEQLNAFNLFGGAFNAALSLAYYMGFSEVYLVGFDSWIIQPARKSHWYERGEGEFFEPTNLAQDFLNALKPRMDIYAVGVEGGSRNVNYVAYETLTGRKPSYTENTSLLTPESRAILSTFPGYRI
ncbi:MAG: hypothetical protein QM742_11860 [Aquabacterium sp.]